MRKFKKIRQEKERSILMLKKCTGLFLAMVLAMALCPAVAMAATTISKDMETWGDGNIPEGFEENFPDGAPDGFTVTTKEGAQITCDEESLYGNTTKKMKIVHSENVTTTVAVQLNLGNTSTNSSEYSIYFVLSELTEGDGVKLGIKDTGGVNAYETYFFKETRYEKWRKMMTFYAGVTKNGIMTVTFSGKGTLYLDNAEGKVVNTVVNGDLEGLIGDGKLAGSENNKGGLTGGAALWTKPTSSVAPWQEEPTVAGKYFVETNDNNYFLLVNQARTAAATFSSESGPDLTAGKSYRLRIDHKSTGGIGGGVLMSGQGFNFPYSSTGQNYTCPAADWTEKAFVFVHGFGSTAQRVYFQFVGGTKTNVACKSYFDNLRIEEVIEETGLLDFETKETLSALPNGEKVTVFFKKPLINVNNDVYSKKVENGADGTKPEYVAAKNGYETEKKITVFAALYENTGTTKKLKEIGIVEKGGITVRGAEWADSTNTLTEIGFLPAHAGFDFEIPKEGNYEIKLMAWDDVASMTPAATEVYTYTTAPEA